MQLHNLIVFWSVASSNNFCHLKWSSLFMSLLPHPTFHLLRLLHT